MCGHWGQGLRGRGLREQFDVHHGLGTTTHCSADAIIARVAATYGDVLVRGTDIVSISQSELSKALLSNCNL